MTDAGLVCNTLRDAIQLPNSCGYLSAGWASELHQMGVDFDSITKGMAEMINHPNFILRANNVLGDRISEVGGSPFVDLGETADWMTGDEILTLADHLNPNDENMRWLSGPGPMNYWRTHFARTLITPAEQGQVHIFIVNTAEVTTVTSALAGEHWFVVAWFVNPQDAAE